MESCALAELGQRGLGCRYQLLLTPTFRYLLLPDYPVLEVR